MTITSTDDGAVDAPILTLFRDSASPADSDDLGQINFKGKNDAAQDVDYGLIVAEINDASDGTESGELQFVHIHGGSGTTPMQHKNGKVYINNGPLELGTGVGIRFEGATADTSETTLTVTDPTADRTITLPDATGTVQLTDGSGASLTSLNASQLSSGTVPNARLDQQLQDVAGLAVTNGNFIVGDGSNFVAESGATARASLGLGTAATSATGDFATAAQGSTADSAMQDLSDDTSPTLGGALSTGGNQIQLSQTSGNAIVTTGSLSSADLGVLRASAGTGGSDTHGFTIKYMGSRSGNNNSYSLFMDNQTGTDVEAITVLQDGKVGINNTTPSAPLDVTGNIVVSGTVDGRDLATDGTKLDGIEASADVTDTANVTAAGALMDSEVTNLAQVKAFDSSDYATAAQGTTADAALPKAGGTMTGNLTLNNVNLLFEGSTADANETVITAKDPTADNIIYVPDSSGTLRVVQRKNLTGDLAVGWRTIAVLEGRDSRSLSNQRLIAKFTVADIDTSRHNMFSFRAQHSFGQDNSLQVENYCTFSTDSITGVRIKASTSGNGIYAGAVIQIYVADANNAIVVYLDENDLENGQDDLGRVILKDGIADATDPGNVGYSTAGYSTLTEQVQIDLQRIEPGGIATTGDFYTYSDIKFEGSTTDANETTLTVTTPTADRTITLPDATGQVVISDGAIDTEASAEIGRAHIGAMGHSDFAGFSHIDQNGTGSYALLQHSGGGTHLNAASGNSINFNINNANVMNMDNTGLYFYSGKVIAFEGSTDDTNETTLTVADPTADRTITLPDATGTVLTTGNSDTPTTTTSSSDADFVLVDDGGTMKKITPANLGITAGAASTDDATALAIALG